MPPEVELEGLDMAEFQADFYPEFERPPEVIIEPDGTEVAVGADPARGVLPGERSKAGAPDVASTVSRDDQ